MKKADDDFSAIDTITEELMKKKIDCVKYNYNLDPSVQNLAEFEATIHLDQDRETITIINMKPIPNEVYVLNSDPVEIERM